MKSQWFLNVQRIKDLWKVWLIAQNLKTYVDFICNDLLLTPLYQKYHDLNNQGVPHHHAPFHADAIAFN
jgi:hypothetical protein